LWKGEGDTRISLRKTPCVKTKLREGNGVL